MLTTIALIDNSPKNWRKFYGGMIRDAMIEYAEFTKTIQRAAKRAAIKTGSSRAA
ncbi:hypothetical protein IC615_18670 [Serratia ureilytica]